MISTFRALPPVGHKIPFRPLTRALGFNSKKNLNHLNFGNASSAYYTSSGTAALVVALSACKRRSSRRKVILPAYTCPSVLSAVEQSGLQSVLCDLAPGSLGIDETQLSRLLDQDTLAVIYVHLFGLDRNVPPIGDMVRDAGALLIEDAAQAFGVKTKEGRIGNSGDLAVFSFGRGKPLSTLHGGVVIVNSEELLHEVRASYAELIAPLPKWFGLYYRILLLAYSLLFNPKWFGLPQALPWFGIGETVYIDKTAMHAMYHQAKQLLHDMVPTTGYIQKCRSNIASYYLKRLNDFKTSFIFLPAENEISTGPLRFPVVLKNYQHKATALKELTQSRMGVTGSYPMTLNLQKGVPDYITAQGPFKNAECIARGILTLPTHELVTIEDADMIIKTLIRVC